MTSGAAHHDPGHVTISFAQDTYSPGDTVNFTVTVSTHVPLKVPTLVAELFGVEEIEPGLEDQMDFGEAEEEVLESDETLSMSTNGEALDGEDEGEEEDWDEEDDEDDLTSFTHEDEATLATNLSLKAGETRTFNGSFTLPADAQPSYYGVRAAHTWWVEAYTDGDGAIGGGKEFLVR